MKVLICSLAALLSGLCAQAAAEPREMVSLSEPSQWFSIPFVGISRLEASPDGMTAWNKGTVAYKNKLSFTKLRFELSFDFDGQGHQVVLLAFNKDKRDSSIDQHHLDDMSHRGYGLLFDRTGRVRLIRTSQGAGTHELLAFDSEVDFSLPQQVEIEQKAFPGGPVRFVVRVGPQARPHAVAETLPQGYASEGFISLTIYEGRTRVTLGDIRFSGTEMEVNDPLRPRPPHLADYFEDSGRRFVHWRYDEGTSNYAYVEVQDAAGRIAGQVPHPQRFWAVKDNMAEKMVVLTAVDVDGDRSEPVVVSLVDDHAKYYLNGPMPRIGVQPAEPAAYFVLEDSGTPVAIKGFNYVRLRLGHANFEAITKHYPDYYDPYEAESVFKLMKQTGHNCVRVFISGRNTVNPGIAGDWDYPGLYNPYMDNVIDFLRRARKYGIYVLPCLCDGELPRNKHYMDLMQGACENPEDYLQPDGYHRHNARYLTAKGVYAKTVFLQDFLRYIQNQPGDLLKVLLGLSFQNELYLIGSEWPFTLTEGTVTTANGRSYDMADDAQRWRLYEEGINYYHNEMIKAAQSVDPKLLLGEGFYTPRIVEKDYESRPQLKAIRWKEGQNAGWPPRADQVLRADVDFIDIHIYHLKENEQAKEGFRRDMETTGLFTEYTQKQLRQKPWILGEFGSFKRIAPTWEQAKRDILATRDVALSQHVAGTLMWTLDSYEQRLLWHATEGGQSFLKELSDWELKR